jgi:putative endopeptidase
MAAATSGIDLTSRDESVRPQDDFYRAWHGRWLDEFEIPADKAEYASFTKLRDESLEQLRDIIDDLVAQEPAADTSAGKIAILYADFMNTDAIGEHGLSPLQPLLADIAAVDSPAALAAIFGRLDREGVGVPIGTYVHQDNRDSTRYLLDVRQSGLGLPDRDYYLDDRFAEVVTAYRNHIARMWQLAGLGDEQQAAEAAERILSLETTIAQAHWDNVRNRDPQATYNLLAIADADSSSPGLDLAGFLAAGHAPELESINVGQPDYLTKLGELLGEVDVETWRDYLRFRVISGYAPYLPAEIDAENFAFYGTTLTGAPQQRPRWKRGVDVVQQSLGEALGEEYVQRHFPPENKARMLELVDNLLATYAESIDSLEWMSADTKAQARAKLATFRSKIGYPDVWRDYSALQFTPGDLIGNLQRASYFEHDRDMAKLGGPIDHEEWFMPPQMVNAYYNPEMNEIVFPAAILQPPFFNMAADDAVNYGAIGAVIGHEISHGFDDKGCQYDGDGNLRNWWTETDHEAFSQRTTALVRQYADYEPVAGHPVNGELTLGENIADVSGVAVAYRAYQKALAGSDAPVIDGLTGAQRFFIGYAQVWRAKTRDEEAVRRVTMDPHSPPQFRVTGVLVNNDDFAAAFDLQPGDGMWRDPDQRVRIW